MEPFKVRCVDNVECEGTLTEGHIYTVIEIDTYDGSPSYHLLGLPGGNYRQRRFVKVEEVELPPDPKPTPLPLDLSDWRVWRDHGLQPDECPCKILRENCWIHRGGN